ncbi:MAG: porin [Tepidimonas ignava]|uniref:porin n=1 Tax=Tepidimonas ignava TaxID=114249 RepID=UPI00391D1302
MRPRSSNLVARLSGVTVAALACAGAHAQSNVQLYGLVDAGITHVTGLRQGSVTQLASGIMEGSRWGLKGTEDLGGGYKAIFTLESRFEVDTGSLSNRPISGTQVPDRIATPAALGLPNALAPVVDQVNASIAGNTLGVNLANNQFDRQAYMGLITPVGAVLAGRMYTPDYEISAAFDAMETQSALAAGQLAAIPAGFDIRISNALQYRIQTGGVTAALMYGFGETGNSSSNKRFVGAMGMYKGDGYAVGLGYNTRNNELGQKSLTTTTVGGWVNVGPGKLSAVYSRHKDDHPSDLSALPALVQGAYMNALKQRFDLFNVGYRVTSGPHTVTVAYTNRNEKTSYDADARSYGVAYTYALSKRTDLNAVLVRFDNRKNGQAAPGGNGYLGGVTRAAGVDSTSLALGIRHRF